MEDPEIIRLRAEIDQQIELNKESAKLYGAYFRMLIGAGIPPDVAGQMTIGYHSTEMMKQFQNPERDF